MRRRHLGLMFPPGTCQTPAFFWRGGDEFKEAEHLHQDFIQARAEHVVAKRELEEVKNEYAHVSELLSNRDKQAVALASALGGSSQATSENSKLNKQIADLSLEISETEEKIAEATRRAQPLYISQLEKERSGTYVTVERLLHEAEAMHREKIGLASEFCSLLTCSEWMEASNLNAQHQILSRERTKLRGEVKKSFGEQNYAQESKKDSAMRQSPNLLAKKKDELETRLYKAQHERFIAQTSRKAKISAKLDMIMQLNNALIELNQEVVDIEVLKQKYLPDGPFPPIKRPATTMANRGFKSTKSIKRPLSQSSRSLI